MGQGVARLVGGRSQMMVSEKHGSNETYRVGWKERRKEWMLAQIRKEAIGGGVRLEISKREDGKRGKQKRVSDNENNN